ncbi:complement C1q tumor necrosis factor-related protein 3 isoform X1 [Carlito syrichta]|uniref:Complement C1q tumor necrosis factor-related protein 3 n=1 Tax=Carlito syrichta TaxID=1868482 RepID=A0A1U7U0J7_CARSF|nr:complement C1q tumor necrosis factor-related protein 3 isoform X1 [Carlito syrichta]
MMNGGCSVWGGGLLSLWRACSLIYYTPKYKTTQLLQLSAPALAFARGDHAPGAPPSSQGGSEAPSRIMLGRQLICWHLLALFFLPFCLCQDEYMEVSGRANNVVARIVQSHQQTGRSGSRREKVRERSYPKTGTVDNNTSADLKSLRPDELPHPEVDDLAQITPFWGQSPPTGGLPPDCSKCCHGDYNFRGYQGPPGPPGPPGIPGNHGNNGNNGATGHEGAKGEKGDKGDLGPRGERGQHGPKGEKGYPGIPPELQIAFMASLATHFSNQNSGIIFSSVETNIGNFFDVMTGRFGAPVSGVYFFTFSMMKHEDVEEVYVYLMHNGNTVFSMYSYETKGKSDTSSNHAVLKLAKGDEVWLRMGNGALHGDHQRFSTFAGFLLFETK